MSNIEDTISDDGLPVNTIAMSNRLIEILKEADTNSATILKGEDKKKFRKCLWLINQQVYGQLGTIDMCEEWSNLTKETDKSI